MKWEWSIEIVFFWNDGITSETFTADLVGTEDTKLEDIECLDLVTDLASRANLLSPATETRMASLYINLNPPRPYRQYPSPRPQ